jgi:hypothetical protein
MKHQGGFPMANMQRKQTDSSGQPTISVRAEHSARSLASELSALVRRRILKLGLPGLALVLVLGGLLYACGGQPTGSSTPDTQSATAGAVQPTALPTAQAPTVVEPAAQATTAPAPQANPTSAPAATAVSPANGAVPSVVICPEIAGLPIYANAACIKHDADQDDGVTKNENTYLVAATTDEVRRFYEGAFSQNGWTVTESKQHTEDSSWDYTVTQAQRRLKVEVENEQEAGNNATRFTIKELSPIPLANAPAPSASSSITCAAIAGLPLYPNATCIKHDTDQDDGVTKNENTYLATAAADDVRRFFEGAFTQNGWAIAETKQHADENAWEYTIAQAQRRLKVEVEGEQEAGSVTTHFTIKELSLAPVAQPTAGAVGTTAACPSIDGLPLLANATCIEHDSDQDDGVTKSENRYVTTASVDEVRRFYEGAFGQNGWTIAESKQDVEDNAWAYTITQAQRRLKLEIEPRPGANGAVTRITIAEK